MTRDVIKALGLASAISMVLVAPNAAVLIEKYIKHVNKKNARKTLTYLKYRQLITVKEINGEYHYRLTKKGMAKYQKISMDELFIPTPKRWDGKWRMVLFDIPTRYNSRRSILIDKLRQMDFYLLQHSAWIHPFDGEMQVGVLIKNLELEKQVSYLVVEGGNFVDHVSAHFKAKRLLL